METNSISRVQVFSAGEWNGDKYSVEDLDDMVRTFEETQKTVRPFLKLGHPDKQKLIQSEGLPAAGWVTNLYRVGEKLYADFSDIPKKIFDLIKVKAYRKVSCEIYLGVKIKEKAYKYMVGAIALLGAETPGVMNLDDILSLYAFDSYDSIKSYEISEQLNIKTYSTEEEHSHMSKTEEQIKLELELADLKKKAAEAEADVKKFKSEASAKAEALEAEQKEKRETEEKLRDLNAKLFSQSIENTVSELVSQKLITPSMKQYAVALLGEEKKEYSFKAEDKEMKLDKAGVFKEICKLFNKVADVNQNENTVDTDHSTDGSDKKVYAAYGAEIAKYMDDNKCSYKEAYKATMKGKEMPVAQMGGE